MSPDPHVNSGKISTSGFSLPKGNFDAYREVDAFGLSANHKRMPKRLQEIEVRTRLKRAEKRIPSVILGPEYEYGSPQLQRKSPAHLFKDFGISAETLSVLIEKLILRFIF